MHRTPRAALQQVRIDGRFRVCGQPLEGHTAMTIGVSHLRDELQVDRLPQMLAMPFSLPAGTNSAEGSDAETFKDGSTPEPRP